MTFQQLFEQVRTQFSTADVSTVPGKLAFQFNITGEGGGIFYTEVLNGNLSIEPYDYHDRDAAITISSEDLLKMLEGRLDPVLAFTVGKLKVDGDIGKALELQKFLNRAD